MNSIDRVPRLTLADAAAEKLRGLIGEGSLAPGERLTEAELSGRLGISRIPLREALRALAAEGIVTIEPHKGAVVTPVTPEEVDEVFPVLAALEGCAGELAAVTMDEAAREEIAALHAAMLAAHKAGRRRQFLAHNETIHERIVAAARNPTLASLHRALSLRLKRIRYVAQVEDSSWERSVAEHEAMMDALARRDGRALGAAMREHLASKREAVREAVARASA
ncbi:GntR family transcriptional regulator [Elioraea rosea]|uniref:GntR family transcriptional regulator n=1 Tax=Elioraea rosea TaxID=2492390 RepID=UPI001183C228|nr:GntR family transcriptional regulator [Elioraea rosea]